MNDRFIIILFALLAVFSALTALMGVLAFVILPCFT